MLDDIKPTNETGNIIFTAINSISIIKETRYEMSEYTSFLEKEFIRTKYPKSWVNQTLGYMSSLDEYIKTDKFLTYVVDRYEHIL